ncbi:HAD-like domain-containing protein [Gloeopeniophorella convolvens]|nr:HAD-like domain-containing protein [Gloeopeniophorella convolvens]
MSSPDLSQFKTLIFDVYGTLVDWETGIYDALAPLLAASDQPWSKLDALTAFGAVESDLQTTHPTTRYSDILAQVHDELARRLRGAPAAPAPSGPTAAPVVSSSADPAPASVSAVGTSASAPAPAPQQSPAGAAFAASLARWPVFPDTVAGLAKLASLGLRLAPLSNVDRAAFAHTRAALERGFVFDAVYTAEEIGSYKPDPRNFEYAIAQLRAADPALQPAQILVVAQSLPHDHVPARALGLASVWIDRPGALTCLDGDGVPVERAAKEVFATWRFRSLGEFADAMEEAKAKVKAS